MRRRDILWLGGAGMAGLMLPRQLWARPADPLALVDPDLRRMAAILLRVQQGDTSFAPPGEIPIPDGTIERQVPGTKGNPPVTIYIVNAAASGDSAPPRGAIFHTHGGGFISGSARTAIRQLRTLCEKLGCVGITVEYRLAPVTPFPGGLEDSYTALAWVHAHADELGIDPARIALFGESAGGGLAAMLAIAARDRGVIQPVLQALIYPMLDDRTGSSRPVPPQIGQLVWTARNNREGWGAWLGQAPGRAKVPYGAVPARVPDLRGVAPAFIAVGTLDLFVEEDIAYARRLIDVAVPTELMVVPGAFHGFDVIVPNAPVSRHVRATLEAALARALRTPEPA